VSYLHGTLWIIEESINSFLLHTFKGDLRTCFFIHFDPGIVECWNNGESITKTFLICSYLLNPAFQYSSVPSFQFFNDTASEFFPPGL
jgi:hypothetical protein